MNINHYYKRYHILYLFLFFLHYLIGSILLLFRGEEYLYATGYLFSILLVELFRLVFRHFLIHGDCLLVYPPRNCNCGVRGIERRGCSLDYGNSIAR